MEELTIDVEKIRSLPNGSVTDAETIRQIAMWSIRNPNDNDLVYRIKPSLTFVGLYPHIMKPYNIIPEEYKKDD